MSTYSSKSLATKYRPKLMHDIVGQSNITDILENQLANKTFRNTVLFTGPAGCGKTTSARAFARVLNNGKGTPIEIDAASNNGVENVRDIIVKAQQKSLDSEYKVFIIDECHSISNAGFQAFLKLIEEPPANTVFIFCTTDPQKIPATILSRVQRFDFKRISFENIVARLKYISEQEGYVVYDENDGTQPSEKCVSVQALGHLAKISDGGMRDAITSLDKCMAFSDVVNLKHIIDALGTVDYQIYFDLTNAIFNYEEQVVIEIVEKCHRNGSDLKQFVKQYTLFLLDICKYVVFNNFEYIQIPDIYKQQLQPYMSENAKEFLKFLLDEVNKLNSEIKWESSVKNIVQLKLLLLTQPEN